jgi:hypothetical protein
LYVDDRDGSGTPERAYEALEAIAPQQPADNLRTIGIEFVSFGGVWPFITTSSNAVVFARDADGQWRRASQDEVQAHLVAGKARQP